jgi:hypothetical protein
MATGRNKENIWRLMQAGTPGHPASAIAQGIKKKILLPKHDFVRAINPMQVATMGAVARGAT